MNRLHGMRKPPSLALTQHKNTHVMQPSTGTNALTPAHKITHARVTFKP